MIKGDLIQYLNCGVQRHVYSLYTTEEWRCNEWEVRLDGVHEPSDSVGLSDCVAD